MWITASTPGDGGWDNPGMSKITVASGPFAAVSNEVLFDRSVSLPAKGLFAYLRAKPGDWDFSCYRIGAELGVNEKTCRRLVLELEAAGLVRRTKRKTGVVDYEIAFEKPTGKNVRQTICPADNFTAITNKDIYIPETKKDSEVAAPAAAPEAFDFGKAMEAWESGPDPVFHLMAFFFARRKLRFASRAQLSAAVSRHIRAAREVVAWPADDIRKAMDALDVAERQRGIKWTLESVKKELTK